MPNQEKRKEVERLKQELTDANLYSQKVTDKILSYILLNNYRKHLLF